MQKVISLFLGIMVVCSGSVWSQDKDVAWKALGTIPLSVNQMVYDFGEIEQFSNAKCTFEFLNTDSVPLILKHVTTSCDCTAPSFTQKPIKQGKTAGVKIKYDTSNLGVFSKSVFVYTNKQEKPIKLSIKGIVKKDFDPQDKSPQGISKVNPNMKNSIPNSSK